MGMVERRRRRRKNELNRVDESLYMYCNLQATVVENV